MESERNGKATLVITYNSVEGYPTGTYNGKNGPVVVHSNGNTKTWGREEAEGKLGQIMHGLYGKVDQDDVKQIYLYVGLYAKHGALSAASNMAGNGKKLTLVACGCDRSEKSHTAERIGAPIIWSECGGRHTLNKIVSEELTK